jgi:serine/threonine-protein kinase RsbW
MNSGPLAGACQAGRSAAGCFAPDIVASSRALDKVAVAAVFPGLRDQVRQARHFTARNLNGWPAADEVVLVVSELAANAVVHSVSGKPGGIFWLHVTAVPGEYVRIEVCDQGGPWVTRGSDPERPHGLDIVRRLAAGFGVEGDARTGRMAWARFDLAGRGAGHGMPGPALGCDLAAAGFAVRVAGGRAGRAGGDRRWPG